MRVEFGEGDRVYVILGRLVYVKLFEMGKGKLWKVLGLFLREFVYFNNSVCVVGWG